MVTLSIGLQLNHIGQGSGGDTIQAGETTEVTEGDGVAGADLYSGDVVAVHIGLQLNHMKSISRASNTGEGRE